MKASILTTTILFLTLNLLIAKEPTRKPNTDLLGSLQHITNYNLEDKMCYQTIENYQFYSDNSCKMATQSEQCRSGNMVNDNMKLRWLIVNNYIVLLDENGKTERYFVGKDNVKNMLIGQKSITAYQSIDYDDSDKIFSEGGKSELLSYNDEKP